MTSVVWVLWATAGGGVAQAAELAGSVREVGTGDPLPGALVQVLLPSGVLQASTGPRGGFALAVPDDLREVRLVVSHGGHLPLEQDLVVPLERPLRLSLTPEPPAAEIVVEAARRSDHAARHILDRERVEQTPGTFDDPVRLVQALPGVAVTPEYSPTAGVLAIRGAAPGESRVFLDGVEIPYLYHFQNYASVIHSRLLDEVALYPSAFASEWGDAVGGIVSVTTRRPDPARVHGGVNANAITTGAYVQAPLRDGAAVSLSGRRSIADLIDDSNDQYTVWPVFWDYLGRADLGQGDRTLAVTLVGAGDRYGRYPGDTATFDPLERDTSPDLSFSRAFHALTVSGRVAEADQVHRLTLGLTQDTLGGTIDDQSQLRRERAMSLRYRSDLIRSSAVRWSFGGDGRVAGIERVADPERAWTELGDEVPMLAAGIPVDEQLQRVQGGVWAAPQLTVGRGRLHPGLRVQGDTLSGAWAPEPRLSTAVDLSADHRLRGSVGRYSQAPSADALSAVTGDPTLPLALSDQVAVGADVTVAGQWELSADVYGRATRNTVEVDPGDAEGLGAVRVRDARAGGIELVTRTRQRDHYFFSASLALSRSQRRIDDTQPWVPGDHDQPFAFNLVGSWDFAPGWNAGLRYRLASGLPYTPLSGTYDGDTDTYRATPGPENSDRLPTYQKVDLHLERAWTFPTWTLVGYLEAWWVPPRSNAMYVVYSYDYTQRAPVAGPPFVPLLGMRAEL